MDGEIPLTQRCSAHGADSCADEAGRYAPDLCRTKDRTPRSRRLWQPDSYANDTADRIGSTPGRRTNTSVENTMAARFPAPSKAGKYAPIRTTLRTSAKHERPGRKTRAFANYPFSAQSQRGKPRRPGGHPIPEHRCTIGEQRDNVEDNASHKSSSHPTISSAAPRVADPARADLDANHKPPARRSGPGRFVAAESFTCSACGRAATTVHNITPTAAIWLRYQRSCRLAALRLATRSAGALSGDPA